MSIVEARFARAIIHYSRASAISFGRERAKVREEDMINRHFSRNFTPSFLRPLSVSSATVVLQTRWTRRLSSEDGSENLLREFLRSRTLQQNAGIA